MGVTHQSSPTLCPPRSSTLKLIPSEFDSVISEHGRNIMDSWEHKETLSKSLPLPPRKLSSSSVCKFSSRWEGLSTSEERSFHCLGPGNGGLPPSPCYAGKTEAGGGLGPALSHRTCVLPQSTESSCRQSQGHTTEPCPP